jgi:glycosyltransferase involved in cell wall biosynthesis
MAEGLPCIASNVGGIPELLPEDVLVPVNNVDALAAMMEKFFNDADFYNSKANQNLEEAKKYKKSILDAKRLSFFNHLKTFN